MERLVAVGCPDLTDEGARGEELRTFARVVEVIGELCPWVEPIRLGLAVFPVRGPSRLLGGDDAVVDATEQRHAEGDTPKARAVLAAVARLDPTELSFIKADLLRIVGMVAS
jgi:hypothetical protein